MEEIMNLSNDEIQSINNKSLEYIKQFSWDLFAR